MPYKDIPSLLNNQLYPKPELNGDFYSNSFKDGYKLKGNEARLGKGRLNYLISEYGVWDDSDYAQAYLGFIDPREFIKGTLTGQDTTTAKELANPSDLDLERINNERQTPFLDIDFENNEILGHEGRHRLSSFAKAGINRLPIVIRDRSPNYRRYHSQAKRNYNNSINGQDFGFGRGQNIALNSDLIPINYKNIADLYKIFGDED